MSWNLNVDKKLYAEITALGFQAWFETVLICATIYCNHRRLEEIIKTRMMRRRVKFWFEQQNGKCCHCGNKLKLEVTTKAERHFKLATADHVIPQSLGGSDHIRNIRVSCQSCNSNRGTMDFEEFKYVRSDSKRWQKFLEQKSNIIKAKKRQKIIASLVEYGWDPDCVLDSDKMKEFNQFRKQLAEQARAEAMLKAA